MIDLDLPFRRATPDDAGELAVFVNMAGEGFPLYLWQHPGEEWVLMVKDLPSTDSGSGA